MLVEDFAADVDELGVLDWDVDGTVELRTGNA